jgi:hypothetical protein
VPVRVRNSSIRPASRWRRRWLAAAAGVLLAGLVAAPAQADEGGLTGTVTDLATGDPIAGACVSAVDYYSGNEASRACTGADGTYALTVPVEGPYKVRATADGYHELWQYNKTNIDSASAVYLSPTSPAQPIAFKLFHQTATVSGRITDAAGSPVESVDVRVIPEDSYDTYSSPYGYSDADGRYTVTDVIPGRYRVLFMDNTLGQLYAQGSETREAATIFDLRDGASITVDDSFLPMGTVEMTVVDSASHRPVTHACVEQLYGREPVCDAADGVYRLTNVPPGYQSFSVTTGTHEPATVNLDVVRGQVVRATVGLTRTEAIVTQVVDRRTGRPVAGVCAILATVGSHGLSANQVWSCSGADGRLVVTLTGAPGTYQMYMEPGSTGYGAQWVGVSGGTGNRELARKVTVAAGANVTTPAVRMDRPGSIAGVVRAPSGATGSACALPYAPEAGGLWRESPACTDAQGGYTISGLGPYDWPVLFMGDAWIWSGNKSNRYAATPAHVTAGRTATMNAVIPAGAVITGQVQNAAGTVVDADVSAYNAMTGDFAGPTSGAYFGQPYQLRRLAAQPVRIEYALPSAGYMSCWYNGTTDPRQARPVRVPAGATLSLDLTGCG